MKVNDFVVIKITTTRYSGYDLCNKIGQIKQIYGSNNCNYAVEIHGMKNSGSTHGYFYFNADELTKINCIYTLPQHTGSNCLGKNTIEQDMTIVKQDIIARAFANSVSIKKVIFNRPATIVLWSDGTKTVVKKQRGDRWDPEKGLAMCLIKKLSGNTGAYYKIFERYCNE